MRNGLDLSAPGSQITDVIKFFIPTLLALLVAVAPLAGSHAGSDDAHHMAAMTEAMPDPADAPCDGSPCEDMATGLCCAQSAGHCSSPMFGADAGTNSFETTIADALLTAADVTDDGLDPEAETPPPRA